MTRSYTMATTFKASGLQGVLRLAIVFSRFHGHKSLRHCCTDIGPVIPQVASWRQCNWEVWKLWQVKKHEKHWKLQLLVNPDLTCQVVSSYFINSIQKYMHLSIFILNPWPLCHSLVEIADQGTRHYLWALLDWNIPHVCCFLSVCIHRPEVPLSTKLLESTHKFCRSAIVTCPDSYVTFHKCCGHWWHDSRRHPKCYLGRLGAVDLSDVQTLRTLGYVWAIPLPEF